MPASILAGILMLMIIIPFANKLPFGFQRTLSFLPMINVSAEAKINAQDSTEWRIQMWQAVLPQVPDYLLLGKGYALSQSDFRDMTGHYHTIDAAAWGLPLPAIITAALSQSSFRSASGASSPTLLADHRRQPGHV